MHIGEKETKWLFVFLITSEMILNGLTVFVKKAGTAAAISAAACTAVMLAFFAAAEKLRGDTEVGFFKASSGEGFDACTFAAGVILFTASLFNCALRMRSFASAVSDCVLPQSPLEFVILFFAAASLAAAFSGLEPITRYSYAAGIFCAVFAAIVFVFNIGEFKTENIFPIFGNGAAGIAEGSGMIYAFSDFFYLYILSDFFKKKGAVGRIGIKSIAVSGAFTVIFALLYTLAAEYPASVRYKYPLLRLASLASASAFFQRLDGLVYIIWLFSGFISCGALALFTAIIFAKTFKLHDYRGCVPIMIFIVTVLALFLRGYAGLINTFFAVVAFALTAVTAIAGKFKKTSGSECDEP